MSKHHTHSSDLRGLSRLIMDGIAGVTNMAEAVNLNILKSTGKFGVPLDKPLSKVASMLYRNIRTATSAVGSGIETLLEWMTPLLVSNSGWTGREPVLAVLNGVLGDYLEETHNPLAIRMGFRFAGQSLDLQPEALSRAIPGLNGRILVMVHGLCMNDLGWRRRHHEHGAALARDRGYTPVYLYYNSGRHISSNGQEFAAQMEALLAAWPVEPEQLVILGHSMGGMLARSAYHYATLAGYDWPRQLDKMVFLGTPHHGAPLERGGNWFHVLVDNSSYTAPLSALGKIRSAGITDLRYGNLLDEDWEGHDRFAHIGDQRNPLPLPSTVQCYAIAATTGLQAGDIRDRLLGDGLVPVESALGQHENPDMKLAFLPQNQQIEYGMNHLDLLNRHAVYQQLLTWL